MCFLFCSQYHWLNLLFFSQYGANYLIYQLILFFSYLLQLYKEHLYLFYHWIYYQKNLYFMRCYNQIKNMCLYGKIMYMKISFLNLLSECYQAFNNLVKVLRVLEKAQKYIFQNNLCKLLIFCSKDQDFSLFFKLNKEHSQISKMVLYIYLCSRALIFQSYIRLNDEQFCQLQ